MVWKIKRFLYDIRFILLLLISILALSKKVFADSVYSEGNLSNTYVTYFSDVLNGLSPNVDYVIYRSGQYDYSMAVGKFEFDNNIFSSVDTVTIYKISTNNSSFNSYYQYSVTDRNNFSLSCNNSLVYSNLGNYPDVIERGSYFEEVIVLLLSIILLFTIVWKIFRY